MHHWGRSAGRTAQTSCEHMEIIAGPGKKSFVVHEMIDHMFTAGD